VNERTKQGRARIERVRPMLKKLVQRRFVLGGGLLEWQALWDVAEEAVIKALHTYDPKKAAWSTHAHARADWAMLNALAKEAGRAGSPAVLALRGVYEHAMQMRERGNVLHDSDEQTGSHLDDACDELAGIFGARLSPSPEALHAVRETEREVQAAIAELSERYAAIVRLRHIEGLTLEATAKDLGVSASQIHQDEPRALQQLQAVLRRRGMGAPRTGDSGGSKGGRDPPGSVEGSLHVSL